MRMIVRIAVLMLLALAGFGAAPASADRGGYVIHRFDTRLNVKPNAELEVEERLEIEFSEPRHGIYRTIPIRYADPRGYAYSLKLKLVSVTDGNGSAYGTRVSDEGRYTKLRIGDPNRKVQGRQIYVIRYRVNDALGNFPEYAEIYWNATGHEWNTTIGRSSATVRLPAPLSPDQLEAVGYTGSFGSRERQVDISYPEPGVVRFESTAAFAPLEGLTVAVGWPHGHVRFPTVWERTGRVVMDNWIILLPFGWLGFLVWRYRRSGRDPIANAPVMVRYEPPDISPGGVGALFDESVDLVDITATVVHLAIRRHLTIRMEKRDQLFGLIKHDEPVFKRESAPAGDTLVPHEQMVLNALFANGNEVAASDLANKFYTHIPGIRAAVYDRLVEQGYFDTSPQKVRTKYVLYGFLAGLATVLFGMGWMSLRGIGAPPALIVPIFAGVLTLLFFVGLSRAMPRRTEAGVRMRHWALGFEEYARRVEGDRLERSVTDPRATFEALLPHAMALGVGSEWAERFDSIYVENKPAWYAGQHEGRGFSTTSFERSLSSAMARTEQTMAASPRSSSSSGSGGGGSSGGGGGGGGGGSW